jgi:hypothetical protein
MDGKTQQMVLISLGMLLVIGTVAVGIYYFTGTGELGGLVENPNTWNPSPELEQQLETKELKVKIDQFNPDYIGEIVGDGFRITGDSARQWSFVYTQGVLYESAFPEYEYTLTDGDLLVIEFTYEGEDFCTVRPDLLSYDRWASCTAWNEFETIAFDTTSPIFIMNPHIFCLKDYDGVKLQVGDLGDGEVLTIHSIRIYGDPIA